MINYSNQLEYCKDDCFIKIITFVLFVFIYFSFKKLYLNNAKENKLKDEFGSEKKSTFIEFTQDDEDFFTVK